MQIARGILIKLNENMIRTVWFNEYDKSHMTYDEEMGKTCHRNIRRYKEWTE